MLLSPVKNLLGVICTLYIANRAATATCQGSVNITKDVTSLSSDYFGTGNYLPYTWCRYYITAPAEKLLEIGFTFLDLADNDTCADSVTIFDLAKPGIEEALKNVSTCSINWNSYPVLGPVCGSNIPPLMISRGNRVVVEFCTDYEAQARGWKLEWKFVDPPSKPEKPVCAQTINLTHADQMDNIVSPNHPNNYDIYDNCVWTIQNPNNYYVRLDALAFNLGSECTDNLTVSGNGYYNFVCNQQRQEQCLIRDVERCYWKRNCHLHCDATVNLCSILTLCFAAKITPGLCKKSERNRPECAVGLLYFGRNLSEYRIEFSAGVWDTYSGFLIELWTTLCPPGFQICDDSAGCVHIDNQCDGILHCQDGSDEKLDYCSPECGVSHFPISNQARIVGGVEANKYSIPWQVSMKTRVPQPLWGVPAETHFCGGTIITDRWILTAAHCFIEGNEGITKYKARIGAHNDGTNVDDDLATEILFEKIINHPYYQVENVYDYDYSLIKTTRTMVFRKNVAPACLPRQGEAPRDGAFCLTSGWGLTNPFPNFVKPTKLQQVTVPMWNWDECNTAYNGTFITDRMICAADLENGRDTCQADSGGPLVCKNRYNKYMISGVVSWGAGKCGTTHPGVYADVGRIINWIVDTISND